MGNDAEAIRDGLQCIGGHREWIKLGFVSTSPLAVLS